MSFKYHQDTSGSEVPHFDAVVMRHRGDNVRVPWTKSGAPDSFLVLDQQLIFPTGKVVEGESLLIVEEEQIAIKELRRSIGVVGAAEGFMALVAADFPEIAPLESGRLARRRTTGVNQIVGPVEITFLPRLERQLHVGELALFHRDVPLRLGELALHLLTVAGPNRSFTLAVLFTFRAHRTNRLPGTDDYAEHEHRRDAGERRECEL